MNSTTKTRTPRSFRRLLTGGTTVYLMLMLTAFLFYTGTGGYQAIQGAKVRAFYGITVAYLLYMAICGMVGVARGRLRLPGLRALWTGSGWARRFAVLYLIFTWISALVSPWWPETVLGTSRNEGALTITLYVLAFLLVSRYGRVSRPLRIVFWCAAAAFCGLCIVQLLDYNPFTLYPEGYFYSDAYKAYAGAYLGTIGNVDLVAGLLCPAIPLCWIPLLRRKDRLRWLGIVPLAPLLAVLVRSHVLSALVGIAGSTLLCIPVIFPRRRYTRIALWAGLLGLALAGLGMLYAADFRNGLLFELHEMLHGRVSETFGTGRIRIWRAVLEDVPRHLWFGSGPDTMLHAGFEPFSRYDPGLGQTLVASIDTAHNEYLNVLSQQGIFALVAYAGLLISCFVRWLRLAPHDGTAAALGGAVAAYAIQAFFGISMCLTAPFFWITLGLLAGQETAGENAEQAQHSAGMTGKASNT